MRNESTLSFESLLALSSEISGGANLSSTPPSPQHKQKDLLAMQLTLAKALAALLLFVTVMEAALPYPPTLDRSNLPEDYSDNNLENFLGHADKRSCIRRGAGCDHKPNDCCPNSTCRCNLWGANCRCERVGLLQQWGRKRK